MSSPSQRNARFSGATTPKPRTPRYGLARVLSKLGVCSRSQAEHAIRDGRVCVDGRCVREIERPTDAGYERITLDGAVVGQNVRCYVAINKPRGVVVTASDERGRSTIYDLLTDAGLPWIGPVGRLDRASEGLLLLSNDTVWAAGLTEPERHVEKTYHVQVNTVPDATLLHQLVEGITDAGEHLAARRVTLLRHGGKTAWLEIVLDEGRNRHIRRLLAGYDIGVRRLVRVAIGPLVLGNLGKGSWRHLEPDEVQALAATGRQESLSR